MRVCETGTVFQLKVDESVTFSVNVVFKRLRGWTSGRSIPYKTLCSNSRVICLVAYLNYVKAFAGKSPRFGKRNSQHIALSCDVQKFVGRFSFFIVS